MPFVVRSDVLQPRTDHLPSCKGDVWILPPPNEYGFGLQVRHALQAVVRPTLSECGRVDLGGVKAGGRRHPRIECRPIGEMATEAHAERAKSAIGSRGITANTVAPGAIETDFLGGAVREIPHYNQAFAGMTALGRVGLPDDIGPMVASLLGPDNRWVNGQRLEWSCQTSP